MCKVVGLTWACRSLPLSNCLLKHRPPPLLPSSSSSFLSSSLSSCCSCGVCDHGGIMTDDRPVADWSYTIERAVDTRYGERPPTTTIIIVDRRSQSRRPTVADRLSRPACQRHSTGLSRRPSVRPSIRSSPWSYIVSVTAAAPRRTHRTAAAAAAASRFFFSSSTLFTRLSLVSKDDAITAYSSHLLKLKVQQGAYTT